MSILNSTSYDENVFYSCEAYDTIFTIFWRDTLLVSLPMNFIPVIFHYGFNLASVKEYFASTWAFLDC